MKGEAALLDVVEIVVCFGFDFGVDDVVVCVVWGLVTFVVDEDEDDESDPRRSAARGDSCVCSAAAHSTFPAEQYERDKFAMERALPARLQRITGLSPSRWGDAHFCRSLNKLFQLSCNEKCRTKNVDRSHCTTLLPANHTCRFGGRRGAERRRHGCH